jgi:hypothetical protein
LDGCKVAQANHHVTTGLLPKRPPDALLRPKPADCNVRIGQQRKRPKRPFLLSWSIADAALVEA